MDATKAELAATERKYAQLQEQLVEEKKNFRIQIESITNEANNHKQKVDSLQ